MSDRIIDDFDKAILRDCPFRFDVPKGRTLSKQMAARATRIRRLLRLGFVKGDVETATAMTVRITPAGCVLIGRQP